MNNYSISNNNNNEPFYYFQDQSFLASNSFANLAFLDVQKSDTPLQRSESGSVLFPYGTESAALGPKSSEWGNPQQSTRPADGYRLLRAKPMARGRCSPICPNSS